jgi:hypothetical protein
LHPTDEPARQCWVDQQCQDLRHGQEKALLQRLGRLPEEGPTADASAGRKTIFEATASD